MCMKLFTLCLAVIACATASNASAAPVLTSPTGTIAAVGTKLVGTNIGELVIATASGNVTCSSSTLGGLVTTNTTASGYKMEISSALFGGTGATAAGEPKPECTSPQGGFSFTSGPVNGVPWCFEATSATDEGKIRGGKCSELARGIRFTFAYTSIGNCVYNRNAAAVASVRTDVSAGEDATFTLSGQEWTKTEGSALCAASVKLSMSFTLETEASSPMFFSS